MYVQGDDNSQPLAKIYTKLEIAEQLRKHKAIYIADLRNLGTCYIDIGKIFKPNKNNLTKTAEVLSTT